MLDTGHGAEKVSFSLLVYGMLALVLPDYGQLSDIVRRRCTLRSRDRSRLVHPLTHPSACAAPAREGGGGPAVLSEARAGGRLDRAATHGQGVLRPARESADERVARAAGEEERGRRAPQVLLDAPAELRARPGDQVRHCGEEGWQWHNSAADERVCVCV